MNAPSRLSASDWLRQEWLVDLAISVAMAAVVVSSVMTIDPSDAYEYPDPSAWLVLLAVSAALALAVRRRWPFAVLAVTLASTTTIVALEWNPGAVPFAMMIALYTVAARRPLSIAVAGLAVVFGAGGLLAVMQVQDFDDPLALVSAVAVTIAWTIGLVLNLWRQQREAAMARALEAERTRAATAERAVLAERLRIARELHDVVAHTLSVITLQSAAARRGATPVSARLDATLGAIEAASRTAVADLRRMLGVLRTDTDDPSRSRSGAAASATATKPSGVAERIPGRPILEWVVDVAVAVALAALAVSEGFVDDPSATYDLPEPNVWFVLLAGLLTLPLAVRRRWPFSVLALTMAAAFGIAAVGWMSDTSGLCTLLALYTVAARRSGRVAIAGIVLDVGGQTVLVIMQAPGFDEPYAVVGVLLVFGAAALGRTRRRWLRDRVAAAARAIEAERTKAVAAERAVYAERLRIAGELNDVIGHTLSAITVQAAVARRSAGSDAHPITAALDTVADAGRIAMEDLRRMFDVLSADRTEPATLAPSPGLDELKLLVSTHRAAHGPVELVLDPDVESAPESLRLTIYRLVQEALTNVRKHAPSARVEVTVRSGTDGELVVQIDNDAPTIQPVASGTGHGLAGMRERAAMFDGHLEVGPRHDGGFRVRAQLPATAACSEVPA